MTELKTAGINFLATTQEGPEQLLLVGIKEAYRNKPQYVKALQREFNHCHELDHPNLFRYIDLKDIDGYGPCIRMEWQDSRTITDYLQEQHSEEEKKAIINQVAEALSYLHDQGQVHGALTPGAIFVTRRDNTVKVLNFRQRYADNLSMPTLELRFLAPEAKDGTVTLDARADIYSLGQLLKLMDISDDYHSVIAACCSFGRSERYADVDSFLGALDHRRITHRRDTDEIAPTEGSSRRTSTALVVAVIAALLVVIVLWFINKNSASSQQVAQDQTEQTDTTHPEEAQPAAQSADASQPGAQPDASQTGAQPDGLQTGAQPDATQPGAQPGAAQPAYSGDNAFLNELVPQMRIDLDKIYAAAAGDKATASRKVAAYYKGLRNVLRKRGLTQTQLDAFDQAFAAYNSQKKAQ